MTNAQFLYDACTRPGPAFAARIEAQVRADALHARVLAAHPAPAEYIAQIVEQAWLDGLMAA